MRSAITVQLQHLQRAIERWNRTVEAVDQARKELDRVTDASHEAMRDLRDLVGAGLAETDDSARARATELNVTYQRGVEHGMRNTATLARSDAPTIVPPSAP